MKKTSVLAGLLGILLVAGLTGEAFAGTKGKVVNKRQNHQMHRIGQGVKNGELTARETRKVLNGERLINRYEQKARSDGSINGQEFRTLQRMQNEQSRYIYKQKHDSQDRR